jgi:hypothetical protein
MKKQITGHSYFGTVTKQSHNNAGADLQSVPLKTNEETDNRTQYYCHGLQNNLIITLARICNPCHSKQMKKQITGHSTIATVYKKIS